MKEYIESTLFMGMHSKDEQPRIACKNYFVRNLKKTVYMSMEEVGVCDDNIWQLPRDVQDFYYPFMDELHTVMDIQRVPYSRDDMKKSLELSITLAEAQSDGYLRTVYNVKRGEPELSFPERLEKLYQKSLRVRT